MHQLSPTERTELATLERVIDRGLESFRAVGEALARIRAKRLYRAEFASFGEYCRQKWSFTKQHAGRLIVGAEIAADVEPIGSLRSEAQARELAPLPLPLRRQVFAEATANGSQPTTARTLRQLTAEALAALPPEQQVEALEAESQRRRGPGPDGRPRASRSQSEARRAALKDLKSARRHLSHAGLAAFPLLTELDGFIGRVAALEPESVAA